MSPPPLKSRSIWNFTELQILQLHVHLIKTFLAVSAPIRLPVTWRTSYACTSWAHVVACLRAHGARARSDDQQDLSRWMPRRSAKQRDSSPPTDMLPRRLAGLARRDFKSRRSHPLVQKSHCPRRDPVLDIRWQRPAGQGGRQGARGCWATGLARFARRDETRHTTY